MRGSSRRKCRRATFPPPCPPLILIRLLPAPIQVPSTNNTNSPPRLTCTPLASRPSASTWGPYPLELRWAVPHLRQGRVPRRPRVAPLSWTGRSLPPRCLEVNPWYLTGTFTPPRPRPAINPTPPLVCLQRTTRPGPHAPQHLRPDASPAKDSTRQKCRLRRIIVRRRVEREINGNVRSVLLPVMGLHSVPRMTERA